MLGNKKEEVKANTTQETEQSKFKKWFDNDNYQNGLRVCIICALAIILVVGVNMLSGLLPTRVAELDVSTGRVHSISDDTEAKLAEVSKPVTMYYVCESGEEETNTQVMLNLYADCTDNITIQKIDPAYDSQTVIRFTGETELDNNSIIVVCGDRKQIVYYDDYRSGTTFVLEDYLNAALDFVLGEELRVVYKTTGHDELTVPDTLIAYMGLDGFSCEDIDLMSCDRIPDDASVVLLNGISKDITEHEAEVLIDYLEDGGSILLSTDYTNEKLTNIGKVTGYFGASLGNGIIMESDSNRYTNDSPYYIIPTIYTKYKTLTDGVSYVVLPNIKPIIIDEDLDESITAEVVLETSESAISGYTNIFTGQTETTEGPFTVGAHFIKGEDGAEGEMVWVTSRHLGNTVLSEEIGGGNVTFMLNSICVLGEDEPVPSIHGKSISTQFLDVPDSVLNTAKIIIPGVIPLAVLLIGVVVLIRRKRR